MSDRKDVRCSVSMPTALRARLMAARRAGHPVNLSAICRAALEATLSGLSFDRDTSHTRWIKSGRRKKCNS